MRTPPKYANTWTLVIPHPLHGLPLTEQIRDDQADAYAKAMAPAGWHLEAPCIQGRDCLMRRVIVATYVRDVPNPGQMTVFGRTIVTLVK